MRIEKNVSAERLSTYKGGGVVETLYLPETEEEFVSVTAGAFILGGGSNVIISDGEIATPVVSTRLLNDVEVEDGVVYAEAGARVSKVASVAREFGLGGLEFLAGVPATVGGIVKMNAGAFSSETKDYVLKIKVLNAGNAKWLDRDEIDWGYRKGATGTVLAVLFGLEKTSAECSKDKALRCIERRRETQPQQPSVGSVFKKAELPAGKYIDLAGLKGTRIGGAMISPVHANFIVNVGGGSAEDYIALAELCERRVKEKFGITLEREFEVLR